MKNAFILLVVFALFKVGKTQNVAIDFSNMHNAYLGNYLSLDFEVRQFENAKDLEGKFIGAGKIRKSKKDYYSIFDNQELIVVNDKMISVDHLSKEMCFYNKLSSSKVEKINSSVMDTMLLEHADSVKFNGITLDGKCYSIYTSTDDSFRADVTIDIQTNLVREIVYYYPQSTSEIDYGVAKIVIRYTTLNTVKPDDGYFNFAKYISGGNKPQTTPAYKNYRFTIIN